MSIAPYRLLGFAFAGADLLVELDVAGKITFAVGAAGVLAGSGERSLMGHNIDEFVDVSDREMVWALIAGAEDGRRQGPVVVRLSGVGADATGAFAISLCRLPQNEGAISCTLSLATRPAMGGEVGGLFDRATFEGVTRDLFETARASGQALELSFVEMDGLARAQSSLPEARQTAIQAKIAGALRAQSQGGAAARLDDDRYALVRSAGEAPEALAARLGRLVALTGELGDIKAEARSMALKGEASASQVVKALRYALDDFIEAGVAGVAPVSLQDAVNQSVRHTMTKVNALGSAVADRRFDLVYQPVVSLETGALHHHEVLVRFGEAQSPYPMIRMAEELDLIEDLDLAVVQRAVGELVADEKLKLAVNVSGRTITSPDFIAQVTQLATSQRSLHGRLMFEITESATIDDLPLADSHIQSLRGLGCLVCLDDFGAGAASLAYLQQLSLDLVKIDGRFIRELQHGGRESTFIRHLVRMCAELGVRTVAEMVETTQAEEAVRRAGVDFGQGWLYGAGAERPGQPLPRASGPAAARRKGAVESWG